MTNWHTIKRILEVADHDLSASQVQIRAKQRWDETISMPRVTQILNKMADRGRASKETVQVGRRRIRFFSWKG